jgi:hypothetical protein
MAMKRTLRVAPLFVPMAATMLIALWAFLAPVARSPRRSGSRSVCLPRRARSSRW